MRITKTQREENFPWVSLIIVVQFLKRLIWQIEKFLIHPNLYCWKKFRSDKIEEIETGRHLYEV